uniref:Leiomodin-3 n=1 Tax=Oncorhynchus tshawytscha TaxID=74940 RepID=A0A8C8FU38_ONCTS
FSPDINEEDIDEDDILASLSPEELQELQKEMDVLAPDERVPLGQRQKDQKKEKPSADSDDEDINENDILANLSPEELKELQKEVDVIAPDERVPVGQRGLVDYLYWEKESKRMLEEERIPVTLLPNKVRDYITNGQYTIDIKTMEEDAEKKENAEHMEIVYEVQEEVIEVEATDGVEGEEIIVEEEDEDKKDINYERVIGKHEHPVNKHLNESLDDNKMTPEEKRACFVPEKEVRVINKLIIPSLALGGGLGGLDGAKKTSRPSWNETNLDTTLDKICNNNPTITDVNLNNIENIPKEMLIEYVNALKKNKHVETFSIANIANIAFTLANMLRENRKGIIAIIRCLQFNETLTELRFHNQRHMLGHHAEIEVSRLLKANNTLLKMGYHFEQAGPRMVVTNLLTRNLDRQRQQRNEEQSKQQKLEQKELFEMYERALNLPPGLLAMLGYVPPEIPPSCRSCPRVHRVPWNPNQSPPPESSSPTLLHSINTGRFYHTPKRNPIPQQPPSMDSSGNPLRDIQLKRTPKKLDPFLDLDPRDDRRAERLNVQLRKTTGKQRGTSVDEMVELKATLKDVMKTLKPVPRRRQPPKVDVTPRDELLNEIKKSNVAYLKAVRKKETSLFQDPVFQR